MTCKDCIHYNLCNMYDGPYISVHLEHTCENFGAFAKRRIYLYCSR